MANQELARQGEWQAFRVVPDDVLFFRDSKPASVNLDHYFRSFFPPLPSTLYGMVRTARLCDYGVDLDKLNEAQWKQLPQELRAEIGEWGHMGTLRLRGPWIVRNQNGAEPQLLFPAPADLGLIGAGEETPPTKVVRFLPVPVDRGAGNWSHGLYLMRPHLEGADATWRPWKPDPRESEPESAEGWFVTGAGMLQWLSGHAPEPEECVRSRDLWTVERRIGIGLQAGTRTTEEGRLFSYGYVRLSPGVALGFEILDCALEASRIAWLGGEGRVVHLETGPSLDTHFAGHEPRNEGHASVYLGTPAVFHGLEASAPTAPLPYAAVVRSTVPIGGWDLAHKGPKPLRRGVAAGSVYYVRADEPVRSYSPISDMHEKGFGLTLAGLVPGGGS